VEIVEIQERIALANPGSRLAMDVLPQMIARGGQSAYDALGAIARDPHRGWLDELLATERCAWAFGFVGAWADVLEMCSNERDVDARAALERCAYWRRTFERRARAAA